MRRQLLLAAGVLFAGRLLLSLIRTGPVVVADEVGYLTNARVLAGGVSGQLQDAPFYRGGYSLLIAPLIRLDGDPQTSYRLVLALNALLAASLVPLLYLLLVRSFRAEPRVAFWAALAASLYPSITLFSQVALSENLLLPLTVVWLLCCGELAGTRRGRHSVGWALAAGAAAAYLYAVHGRMIVAAALTILGLALGAGAGRLSRLTAAAGVAVTMAGLGAARLLDDFLVTHNYGGHRPDEVGQRLSTLGDIGGIASFARNLVGQSWYLLVATLGVLAWVALSASREGIRRSAERGAAAAVVLVLMVCTLAGLLVLSALSFPDIDRADMLIYGRYTEILVPPLLAVALTRLPRRHSGYLRPLVLVALGTLLVAGLRAAVHPPKDPGRWNIGSLPFVTANLGPVPLLGAGVVAGGALLLLAALARRRPALVAPAVLVLFLPTTAFVEHEPVLSAEHAVYPSGWTSPGSADTHGRPVAYDVDHHDGLYVNQWFMSKSPFVLFSSKGEAPPARYVISSSSWGADHQSLGPRELWDDRSHQHALFELTAGAAAVSAGLRR
jgi:hypothetical protein